MRAPIQRILVTFAFGAALGLLPACGGRAASTIPDGGVINVTDGRGTARIWGLTFTVQETGSGAAKMTTGGTATLLGRDLEFDAGLTFGDVLVHLGPEVKAAGGTARQLWVDGRDHAYLTPGDAVVIAEGPDRAVSVNGEARPAR